MPNLQWLHFPDLGGGLNQGLSPAAIGANEMAELVNFYPYGTSLRRRGGNKRINADPWDSTSSIVGASPLRKADGTNYLIVGNKTKFARLVGDAFQDLIMNATPGANISQDLWDMVQYKDFLYAARFGAGPARVLRIDGNSVSEAGIDAPTVVPVLSANGAGVMLEGDYQLVYTYANTATNYESSPSAASSVTLAAGGDSIDIVGMGVAADPFVDVIRIYITYPDQEDFYYFAYEGPTSTLSLNLDVALSALGALANFNLDPPPAGIEFLEVWNERLWGADKRFLYYSEQLKAEGFGGSSIINVSPDDGYDIRGIRRHGDRLIIGKTEKM